MCFKCVWRQRLFAFWRFLEGQRLGCNSIWSCVFFEFSQHALQVSVCIWRFRALWVIFDSLSLSSLARWPLCVRILVLPRIQRVAINSAGENRFYTDCDSQGFVNFVKTVLDIYYQVVFLPLCKLNNIRARSATNIPLISICGGNYRLISICLICKENVGAVFA